MENGLWIKGIGNLLIKGKGIMIYDNRGHNPITTTIGGSVINLSHFLLYRPLRHYDIRP